MLCEQCKQREATTHIRRVLNGVAEEHHLCGACAQAAGLFEGGFGLAPSFGLHLGDLFSGFLGNSAAALAPAARCEFCGSSMNEIIQSGHVGCAKCYETFYDQLEPTLQRVHGALEHTGKTPAADPAAQARKQREQALAALREQIAAAVKVEQYEEAARLRDEIRILEEGGASNG